MKPEQLSDAMSLLEDELIEEADAARGQKKRKGGWRKWGAMAACLALIAAVGIPLLVRDASPAQGDALQPGGVPDASSTRPGNDPEGTMPARTDLLVVNEVDGLLSADMDVEYSSYTDEKLPYEVWKEILDDFQEFTGIRYEDFISKVPDTWESQNFYSLAVRGYKDAGLQDEYRLHDYVFDYRTQTGGVVTIGLCAFEAPLRDCLILCDDPRQSEINGVPLVIYGDEDLYLVQFSFENVNYDIETNHVPLEELEELLSGLLTPSGS
ncbi:MAG: hypothetical protein ACI3XJ_04690 [Oscillospiraceae bacterium]